MAVSYQTVYQPFPLEPVNGKVAIVTGANAGVGAAITRAFLLLGIHVVGIDKEWDLYTQARPFPIFGGSFYPLYCDLRFEEDILRAFQFADQNFGGVDILVNNAAVTWKETILNGTTEHYREMLEVNALAPAITTREAVKLILKRGNNGHIVNIVSITVLEAAQEPFPSSIYTASKAAQHITAKKVRQEIIEKKWPIRITNVHAGAIATNMLIKAGGTPEEAFGRPLLQPEHVASTVVWALQQPKEVEIETIAPRPLHGS